VGAVIATAAIVIASGLLLPVWLRAPAGTTRPRRNPVTMCGATMVVIGLLILVIGYFVVPE